MRLQIYYIPLSMSITTSRSGASWLKDLMSSVRFKLAVTNLEHDPQFMLAILTEVMLETQEVTKRKLKSMFSKNCEAGKIRLLEMFESHSDFTGFTRPWALSPTEQKLYSADPKFQFTDKQRAILLDSVHKMLMDPKHLTQGDIDKFYKESPED